MKQIIAIGGGGFSMEPDNPLIDQYVISQVDKLNPKICFVPTASHDAEGYIANFYNSFTKLLCVPTHITCEHMKLETIKDLILEQDILYVGGGNTQWMLAKWREFGIDKWLKEAWDQGILLAGLSAGAMCWFEESLGEVEGANFEKITGLGFLEGSFCPHYDSEQERKDAFLSNVKEQHLKPGIAADDGVAFHYIDNTIHKVVSSRQMAKGYGVSCTNELIEESLKVAYLGEVAKNDGKENISN